MSVILIKTWGRDHFQNSLFPAGPVSLGLVGAGWGRGPWGAAEDPLGPTWGGVRPAGQLLTVLSLLFKGRSLSRSPLQGQCPLAPCCPGRVAVSGAGPSVSVHCVSSGALCVSTCGTVCLDPAGCAVGPAIALPVLSTLASLLQGGAAEGQLPPPHPAPPRPGALCEHPTPVGPRRSSPVSRLFGGDGSPSSVSVC